MKTKTMRPDNGTTITASLRYLANTDDQPVYIASKAGGDVKEHLGNYLMQEVSIDNARKTLKPLTLDSQGFKLVPQVTRVDDFYNENQVGSIFYDEVKSLVKEATGAVRVEIFDHTLRSGSHARQKEMMIREPTGIIHNDYTADSGFKRLRDYFADSPLELERLQQRRFAIFNVWRSVSGPVYNNPLTFCDAQTVSQEELVSVERIAEERKGEIQLALYHPRHHWYYFPDMQVDEALIFKTFDSSMDGRTRFTIHTSFDLPNSVEGTPVRESIEVRCFAFF